MVNALMLLSFVAFSCLVKFLRITSMPCKTIKQLATALVLVAPLNLFADVTQIGNDTLEELRAEGVAIIDIRRADEWQKTGLIEGSHGITFFDAKGNYDVNQWLDKVSGIVQPDQPIVLICAHGVRSSKVAQFLDKRLGFTEVSNVRKGISAWIDDKRPVVGWAP